MCIRDRFKAYQNKDILHLAVHGKSNSSNKYENCLIVKSSYGLDTIYGYEFIGLNSGTPLVVLSACETAKGTYQSGEGLYSLKRFFHLSGSENIVSSLWPVDDSSSKLFFREFYSFQSLKIIDKYVASARILKSKPKYSHPYYWSNYVLSSG